MCSSATVVAAAGNADDDAANGDISWWLRRHDAQSVLIEIQ